ncbi:MULTISPECIES: hypothetical protein [Klebsiella/Raoultella group]|uniref:Uncharacterized protein n=1 Tax=Raoultella ornithinolytica TaxID=54291 RepID=A0A9Q9JH86_RAOOR|nr:MULTISPECIES: hypothetical protein [Klebsiella/Raoultella group]MCE9802865.1 hypothetical protein [Raoultella ornithinolytica]MCE9811367.1 hypothetical protein [Raoultella ornithinolytica]MCE9868336.1 hypothetical protein [Raoultella ornithinolytica]MDL4584179.1 hypothetical protein [Raoultella ornithinolytica]UDC53469.1 hypothetical protein LGM24_18300 [Klebsiella quasipneumoniae subsp. quasipneumoniae]
MNITKLTPEVARESGSILIIVAARLVRRESFTPLYNLCETGKRVISTRELRNAVEQVEEYMIREALKIVDGHDRLTKNLKEAEARIAELELRHRQRDRDDFINAITHPASLYTADEAMEAIAEYDRTH